MKGEPKRIESGGGGGGESGRKGRKINDDGTVGGKGGERGRWGLEVALDHLKPGAQVWLWDTGGKRERIKGKDCAFFQLRLPGLCCLKAGVNVAVSHTGADE